MLKVAETREEDFEWRWNYLERKFDKELKKSSYKQQHQPLGGFAAKYGGFASPPRYWLISVHPFDFDQCKYETNFCPYNVHTAFELIIRSPYKHIFVVMNRSKYISIPSNFISYWYGNNNYLQMEVSHNRFQTLPQTIIGHFPNHRKNNVALMSTTTIRVNYKYILGRVDSQCYERLFKAINGKAT